MPRAVPKARNQALFREVNERIAALAADFDVSIETQDFVCECSQLGCTDLVQLPAAAYARVRDDPATFLVLAGHEDPARETVVERHDGYLMVRSTRGFAGEFGPLTELEVDSGPTRPATTVMP